MDLEITSEVYDRDRFLAEFGGEAFDGSGFEDEPENAPLLIVAGAAHDVAPSTSARMRFR